ncbi:hypothetical protein SD71_12045 [Cohnella kolymensis]|uniref:Uncharacterized protein n=1 Tax=Cohnella kolymensis TaxID=1590652 RepID=A0ABR5A4I7_9BACL|nr:hypothetical protein SD71_12045 [Cohnella kolymensis]
MALSRFTDICIKYGFCEIAKHFTKRLLILNIGRQEHIFIKDKNLHRWMYCANLHGLLSQPLLVMMLLNRHQ